MDILKKDEIIPEEHGIILKDNLLLEKTDYDEIIIDSDYYVIDGNDNFIIGGKHQLFDISGGNITFKNIQFKDFNLDYEHMITNNSSVLIFDNCSFISTTSNRSLIENTSNILVNRCNFLNNTIEDEGALINNKGKLNARNIYFKSNNFSIDYGTCIYNDKNSTSIIDKGTFIENYGEYGPCIYNRPSSEVMLSHSKLYNNIAMYEGGTIFNQSKLHLSYSEFESNKAFKGGAIYNSGKLAINHCQFKECLATNNEAIYNDREGLITLRNSFFDGKMDTSIENYGQITNHGECR